MIISKNTPYIMWIDKILKKHHEKRKKPGDCRTFVKQWCYALKRVGLLTDCRIGH